MKRLFFILLFLVTAEFVSRAQNTDKLPPPAPQLQNFFLRAFEKTREAFRYRNVNNIQDPLPINLESVYESDIDTINSISTGWTGSISTVFKGLHTEIYNSSSTNPKVLLIWFYRTIYANEIGFGNSQGGTFSNVKIELLGSDGSVRGTFDDSGSNITYGTHTYNFSLISPTIFVALRISFCTVNRVGITNLTIPKQIHSASMIYGVDEDTDLLTPIKTAAGDFNVLARLRGPTGNHKIGEQLLSASVDNLASKYGLATASVLYGLNGIKVSPIEIDSTTHELTSIDNSHQEIHDSNHFFYTDKNTLNSAGTVVYLITTPNTTKWLHFTFVITGNAITTVDIYEGSDRTGTTAQTILNNNNRNSAITSAATLHKAISSGTTDGVLIWTRQSGSSSQQSRTGMEAIHSAEKILKQNTKYLIRITSGSDANLTNIQLDWYEHINL